MSIKRLALVLLLAASPAFGASRFVYLNSTGGGSQLNDCPNPAHNSKSVAGNTDELFVCTGGLGNNNAVDRIICDAASGCQAWTTTTGICTNPVNNNGTATTPVVNGTSINFSTPRTSAPDEHVVYGHPQSCVYNMAQSDSCEIHAGTYRKAGAFASENAMTSDGQTEGTCGRSTCWKAFVVAFGTGPRLSGNAYGTSSNPAYMRGAVFNGSTDTWDSNNNKVPDCNGNSGTPVCIITGEPVSYPVIFNGDQNNNGVFDRSVASAGGGDAAVNAAWNVQSGAGYTGDIFYDWIVGCGDPGYNNFCRTEAARPTDNDWIKIDTDADGVMDTNYGIVTNGSAYPATDWFFTKDIEITRMNGGDGFPGSSAQMVGLRQAGGNITEHGNKSSTGLDVDHIYVHDNDYAICAANGAGCETQWAIFHDQENSGCDRPWIIKNSLLYQNNENVFNDDCGSGSECGCGQDVHDNRIIVDVASSNGRTIHMAYWKGIDTIHEEVGRTPIPKQFRFHNNEVIYKNIPGDYLFHDLQSFGNMRGHGLGQVWIYGNLFRVDPTFANTSGSRRLELSFTDSSHPATEGSWTYHLFNNTYDWNKEMEAVMNNGSTGTLLTERNNAYYGTATVHATTAATTKIRGIETCTSSGVPYSCCTGSGAGTCGKEVCSTSSFSSTCTLSNTARTTWFTPGSYSAGAPNVWNGLANYVPAASGPLDGVGSCDPDGDGTQGVDWDYSNYATGTGGEETTWADIAGNVVDCSSGHTQDVGAIQNSSIVGVPTCGNGLREGSEVCDGTDLNFQTCVSQGFTTGTLACCDGIGDSAFCAVSNCTAFDIGNCSTPSPERATKRGVIMRGVIVR